MTPATEFQVCNSLLSGQQWLRHKLGKVLAALHAMKWTHGWSPWDTRWRRKEDAWAVTPLRSECSYLLGRLHFKARRKKKSFQEAKMSLSPFWLAASIRLLAKERRKEPKWPKYHSPKIQPTLGQRQRRGPSGPFSDGNSLGTKAPGRIPPPGSPVTQEDMLPSQDSTSPFRSQCWGYMNLRLQRCPEMCSQKWWQLKRKLQESKVQDDYF